MSPLISTRSALAEALAGWPPPVFDPAGPYSDTVTTLAWVLMAMWAGVFLIVAAALWIALRGSAQLRARLGGERLIWVGGVAFPVVVLTLLLVWSLWMMSRLDGGITGREMHVRVEGNMWWWRVSYLDDARRVTMHDANELHIPVGEPVVLELRSADVIHSFWVPRLSGKRDMIPGRNNLLRIQADQPGRFGGICAEYCGGPHALMGFVVIAHDAASWQRWQAARAAPPPPPVDAAARQGAALFGSAGCAACHRVAGTPANGLAGPDLTRVGSRASLGAGILPNHRGTLIGWVGNAQAIKPGNRMPSYSMLSADELNALASYLETLK
jgi:cytochrome c oxidase subunit 2